MGLRGNGPDHIRGRTWNRSLLFGNFTQSQRYFMLALCTVAPLAPPFGLQFEVVRVLRRNFSTARPPFCFQVVPLNLQRIDAICTVS
jgi:hypothetical protein